MQVWLIIGISMTNEMKKKKYLTPNEAAEILLVSPITIRQWAQKGELPARVTPGGHRRFDMEDLVVFARSRGIEINAENQKQGPLKVLIVDDDVQIQGLLGELISTKVEGAQIEKASDGFEAGQKIMQFNPDVIILDVMMPGLDGMTVCKNIRSNAASKTIKIIAITGFYTEENIAAMLDAGANVCLQKPINFEKLFEVMDIS
jgi:excisionase family DNA binding protein